MNLMMEKPTLDTEFPSSFLFTGEDGSRNFVHDTYQDFFLARYFADDINRGKASLKKVYKSHFSLPGEYSLLVKLKFSATLEFLAGLLQEKNIAELLSEISGVYFAAKSLGLFSEEKRKEREEVDQAYRILESLGIKGTKVLFSSLDFKTYDEMKEFSEKIGISNPLEYDIVQRSISQLDLAYRVAEVNSLPCRILPDEMRSHIDALAVDRDFRMLSGKAQSFVFRHADSDEKKKVISRAMDKDSSSWRAGKLNLYLNKGFKFDRSGLELLLEHLSRPEKPSLPVKKLTEYLSRDKQTSGLLFAYLESDLPNKEYIEKAIAELEISKDG